MKIDIIGAATDLGITVNGSEQAPKKIMTHYENDSRINSMALINKSDVEKSLDVSDRQKNLEGINEFNKRLYDAVLDSKKIGNFPIVLGGDHSLSIASVLASNHVDGDLGVIWIDSHGDYNTFDTTVTGNLHGLPLATITGFKCDRLLPIIEAKLINPRNTVIIGGRDIDPWEMPNILEAGITLFTTDDIKNLGLEYVVSEAIRIASNGTKGIHVSYDLDIIDPIIAPGVSIPAKDGIDEACAYEIADNILKYKELIKSFDLVELNPIRDIDGKTEAIAVNILEKIIRKFS